jgi:hypothetical protein
MLIFLSLITVGFIALNILMFFELKRVVEEGIYFRAYSHYLLYTISKNHRGDENFSCLGANSKRLFLFL